MTDTEFDAPSPRVPWFRQGAWQACVVFLIACALLLGYYMVERARGDAVPEAVSQTHPPHQIYSGGSPIGIQVTATSPLEPNAPRIVVYQDYQDAMSAELEYRLSDALNALASRGEIIIEYRTMTFLDRSKVDGSSQRAAVAAACADLYGVYAAYHQRIFNSANTAGFSDDRLRSDFSTSAGLSGGALASFQSCYDNRRTEDFVKTVAARALLDGIEAVPVYLINGEPFDLTTLSLTDGRVSEEDLRSVIQAMTNSTTIPTPTPTTQEETEEEDE